MSPAQANVILSTPALVRRPVRSAAMSLAIADVYASMTCISSGFWLAVEVVGDLPGAAPGGVGAAGGALAVQDRRCAHVAALAQACLEQGVGFFTLGVRHRFEREPPARICLRRDEVPSHALVPREIK